MGNRRIVFFVVWIIYAFYACEDPSEVGIGFVEEEPLSVTYYDTLSIEISTIKFDSLLTSNKSRLLIGQCEDDKLGDITAKPFFQVGRGALSTYPDEEDATYDSLTLEMVFDGYSYYDTTTYQTYYLYSIVSEMELGDDGSLYNTSAVQYETDSIYHLGQIRFLPRVNRGKPEYLKINDTYGKALFELLQQKDDIVTDTDNFSEYIRGFVLVPDSANTCMLGLSEETNFKLFYSQGGEAVEQEFPIADNIHFSQITAEFADTVFQTLSTQRGILSSNILDDMAFIQGGVGLGIRMEIPYLDYIRELSKNNLVTDAELILTPVKNSYSGTKPLSLNLAAYKVDKYNRVQNELTINPILFYDDEYNEETYYSIDIHAYLEDQLSLLENDGSGLVFTLSEIDYSATLDRLYIGDDNHENKSFLRLIIMNINDDF